MRRLLLTSAGAAWFAALLAQPSVSGPRTLTFRSTVDGSEQPYALYLPNSLEPGKKYPLVVSLHAEDTDYRLNLMQVFGQATRISQVTRAPVNALRPGRGADFIVVSPLARGTMGYEGIAEQDVYDAVADVEQRYPVDTGRVFLTGISMGGGGALRLALTRPDVWAAVAPVCAVAPPGTERLAPNALNLPVRLFHGDLDPLVPVRSSREWQRRLLDLSVPAEYMEYPGVRHNAWDLAYRNGAIFEWFEKFQGNRFPERVRFVTDSYRYSSAYWVRVDGLTPGLEAVIDARQTSANAIRVDTENLDGFTVSLDHPVSSANIDGSYLRFKPAAELSFRRQGTRWQAGRSMPSGKRPGSEGPIAQAVTSRHIYVFGTAGSPSSEELAFRKQQAETAARWDAGSARQRLAFPVKADTDVTAQELENDNLILFGTRETNRLIARFANRFPMSLDAGAADYGLLFIADLGKRYALVSSGLPWWTGFEEAGRDAYRYTAKTYRELATFGDYILFKTTVGHVVAEGRFDRNWKLPPDAAAKLTASGAVTVP